MSTTYIRYPAITGGGVPMLTASTVSALPSVGIPGQLAFVLDSFLLYVYVASTPPGPGWYNLAGPPIFPG